MSNNVYKNKRGATMAAAQALRYVYETAMSIEPTDGVNAKDLTWTDAQLAIFGKESRGTGIMSDSDAGKFALQAALQTCLEDVERREAEYQKQNAEVQEYLLQAKRQAEMCSR